jgi:hypothetical protein
MFALTASFALLSYGSYAQSMGTLASQRPVSTAVHAPR